MWNLQKAFSLRTIKVCQFEIIDGVKYVYCIKLAYKFLLREQVGFAGVLWRLRQCVLNDVKLLQTIVISIHILNLKCSLTLMFRGKRLKQDKLTALSFQFCFKLKIKLHACSNILKYLWKKNVKFPTCWHKIKHFNFSSVFI